MHLICFMCLTTSECRSDQRRLPTGRRVCGSSIEATVTVPRREQGKTTRHYWYSSLCVYLSISPSPSLLGVLQRRKNSKNPSLLWKWVEVTRNIFLGKSSQNSSKPVLIFWSSIQCVFCLYTLLKVVSCYDLSVLSMSDGFPKKKFGCL